MSMLRVTAVAAGLFALSAPATIASTIVEDFSALTPGIKTDSLTLTGGLSVSGTRGGAPAALSIFDTDCNGSTGNQPGDCSGNDGDLATGPGFPITTPKGNALVLQDPNDSAEPNDANEGGSMTFTFAKASFLHSLLIIDLDENADLLGFSFDPVSGSVPDTDGTVTTPIGAGEGRGGLYTAAQLGVDGVLLNGFTIDFDDPIAGGGGISGAVDDIAFTPVPVPAALPMLASALGLAGWLARRRAP